MPMNEKRCVITGLGLVCAIGNDTDECFESALSGKSGITDVKSFDTSNCYSHKGAEVASSNEELAKGKYDRTTALGIKASGEAIKDAGLHIRDALGRVVDYYESEKSIQLRDGGVLECTGEYQLKWIGENTEV